MEWFREQWERVWARRQAAERAGGWTLNPVFKIRQNGPAGRLDYRPVCYVWSRSGFKGWFIRVSL
ncbi:MAG TPA: hypothetical protein VNI01_15490 [Elusimicrobiota bacterium]|jgi:hypothetical protein|nr:hypothetical protein [Elusimicrobiota bacterium]